MPYIKAKSGIRWHYDRLGEGEPIVFIHGWGVDRRIWRQQFKTFSKTHAAVVIDLPGHGKSSWEKVSLQNMAEDIETVFQKLNFKEVNFVGSSFGGLIGLKVFELNPQRIKRLVLVGSQPKFAQSGDYPFGLEGGRIKKLSEQLDSDYDAMIHIFFRSLFTKEERATRRFKWIQKFRRGDSIPQPEASFEILDILKTADLRDILKKVDLPLQFIYGEEDYICPKGVYEDLKKQFPQARFDCFRKMGHFPFLINPSRFNQVLTEFITV